MSADVFAVAGAKGGVGKTTTSINLGAAFAEQGVSVVLVEMDLVMANLVDFLDLSVDAASDPTLHEVLAAEATIPDAIYASSEGFDVLPSGVTLDGFVAAGAEGLQDVLAWLRERYDLVLIDTGAGLNREVLVSLSLADGVVLVSTPRVASVRDVEKTKRLTERVGSEVAGILFVKSGTGTAPVASYIAEFLSIDLLGHVPEDGAVPTSQDAGRPVVRHAPTSPAAEAYLGAARRLYERFEGFSRGGSRPPDEASASDTVSPRRTKATGNGAGADSDEGTVATAESEAAAGESEVAREENEVAREENETVAKGEDSALEDGSGDRFVAAGAERGHSLGERIMTVLDRVASALDQKPRDEHG